MIQGKGSTDYGIGSALARIVQTVLYDQRAILTVCARENEVEGAHRVTVSLPRIVGGSGEIGTVPIDMVPIDMVPTERDAFRRSLSIHAEAQAATE